MARPTYQQAFLEPFDSEKMKALSKELWHFVKYCVECRKPRERFVQECDEAYLCHRYVPDTGAIELIEDSEFGESDIFDNMNLMSIRQTLALMPRNQSWLTVSSRENEAEELIQAIQDQQQFMHKKARTRRNWQRHIKQKNVRGRSGIYWEWHEETVMRRIVNPGENATQVQKFLKDSGMKKSDARKFTEGRYPHIISSGPTIQPIDWYDLWIDPAADIVNARRPAKIVRRYRILEDLMAEKEEDNPLKPKYDPEILKKITPLTLEEIYSSRDQAGGRAASQRIFGALPTRMDSGLRFVPVYIIYMPHFKLNVNGYNEDYWDTYFHLVIDGVSNTPQLIFAEENPSDLGHSHILVDDCIDWYTPWASGGIGLVEKQLSRYNQKNLLQLLMITAAAHSIFPAQLILNGAFRDDEEVSFAPGALNIVQEGPLGLEVMKNVPVPERGTQLGEQLLRFYADDMRSSSGIDGLSPSNAARSLTRPRTATEINQNTSSGSLCLDHQAENDAEMLTDLCQAVFEESQRRLPPDAEGLLEYERYLGDRVVQGRVAITDFRVPRSIQVLGVQGAENRAQDMANLLQGLDIAGRVVMAWPGAVPFIQSAFITAWKKLNIPMPEGMSEVPATIQGMNQQVGQQPGQPGQQINPQQAGGNIGQSNAPGIEASPGIAA